MSKVKSPQVFSRLSFFNEKGNEMCCTHTIKGRSIWRSSSEYIFSIVFTFSHPGHDSASVLSLVLHSGHSLGYSLSL